MKCRGREYLRIIYGPEYTPPKTWSACARAACRRKRSLALREFALGVEALERFVRARAAAARARVRLRRARAGKRAGGPEVVGIGVECIKIQGKHLN